MKELHEKFFWAFMDGISLLKEDKSDQAIKKFEEASEMKASITKEASKENLSDEIRKIIYTTNSIYTV